MLDAVVRIALLSAIFAAVFLVSQVLLQAAGRRRAETSAINLRLRMIRQGSSREEIVERLRKNSQSSFAGWPAPIAALLGRLQRMLLTANVSLTLGQLFVISCGAFLILTALILIGATSAGFELGMGIVQIGLAVALTASFAIPLMLLSAHAQRRRKRIEEQFPVALDVFVRALRSGHPIASAIELLTHEMEDPIGSEFGLVFDEISYGAELTDALSAMADRWGLEDMRMFVICLSVQSETGGNLAEILQKLSEVIRARASLYLKVRALSSEGRMTGWMLTVLPVLTFVGLFAFNPQFYLSVAGDPMFKIGFPVLIVNYLIGFFMIRKLVDLKV